MDQWQQKWRLGNVIDKTDISDKLAYTILKEYKAAMGLLWTTYDEFKIASEKLV